MTENLFDDVTTRLKVHGLTYRWLMDRLNEKGYDVHKATLSQWVHGEKVANKAKEVHDESIKIIDLYCEQFAEKVKEL